MNKILTSGWDYTPSRTWPAEELLGQAAYARVLVYARDGEHRKVLHEAGLDRYAGPLAAPTSSDGPAEALTAYIALAEIAAPALFVVYRVKRDPVGDQFRVPTFHACRIVDGHLSAIGRVRVVSMGRPDDPVPVARIVEDDGAEDSVPIVTAASSGAPGQDERDLDELLARVQRELTYAAQRIAAARTSSDPPVAWIRQSVRFDQIGHLVRELTALARRIELSLKPRI